MKKILHLTVFLAVISAIAGGALAAVNGLTAPIIAEQAMAGEMAGLQAIFPGDDFEKGTIDGTPSYIQDIYEGSNGKVYKVSVQGFKDKVIYLIGIDNSGNFAGFSVQQNNDTQGFGTRVGDAEFTDTFVGKGIDTKVDTLGGATITSTAVVKGIDEVVEYHNAH